MTIPDFVNESADTLVASNLGPVERHMKRNLNMYLSSLEYIPFSMFLRDIWCLFANFMNKHKRFISYVFYDQWYFYTEPQPQTWMLVLFNNFYKRTMGKRFFHMNKTDFYQPNTHYVSGQKSETIVFILDLMDNIQCIKDTLLNIKHILQNIKKVIFIIPYVGKKVKEDFERYITHMNQNIDIELMYLKEFETYSDILKKHNMEPLDADKPDSKQTPIIFDHRIPYPDNANLKELLLFYVEETKPIYNRESYNAMFIQESNLEEDTFTPEQKAFLLSSQKVNIFSRTKTKSRRFDTFLSRVTRTFVGGGSLPASTRRTLFSRATSSKEIPHFIEDASENLKSVKLGPEPIQLKYDRSFLNSYISSMYHIRFNVFLHDLWLVFGNFLKKYDVKDCIFYEPERTKSTTWLNILFHNFYKRMNGVDEMTLRTRISKSSPSAKKTFVYIDDMQYSGEQAKEVLLPLIEKGVQRIILLVPYVSKTALDAIWGTLTKYYPIYKNEVEIFHVKSFKPFKNVSTRKFTQNPIWVPVFFDHKVPDWVSTWNDLVCLHVDCSEPFYKNTKRRQMIQNEAELNSEKFTDDQINYLTSHRVQVGSLLNKVNYLRSNFDELIDPSNKPYNTPAVAMTKTKPNISKFTIMQSSLDSLNMGWSSTNSKETDLDEIYYIPTKSHNIPSPSYSY